MKPRLSFTVSFLALVLAPAFGFNGPFDFDVHPTNLGHAFIAGEFKKV